MEIGDPKDKPVTFEFAIPEEEGDEVKHAGAVKPWIG